MATGCAGPQQPSTAPAEPTERRDYLSEAVRLSEARKYDRAIAVLLRLQAEESPSDAATTHYLLGSAYAATNDTVNAAAQYAAVVAQGEGADGDGIAPETLAAARLGAGHFSFLSGHYADAIRYLSAWRRQASVEPNPEILMELAQAHSHVDDSTEAVAVAEAVVAAADAAGRTVPRLMLERLADFYYGDSQWLKSLAVWDRIEEDFPVESGSVTQRSARTAKPRPGRQTALPDTEPLRALEAETRALLRR